MVMAMSCGIAQEFSALLNRLGVAPPVYRGGDLEVRTPITGEIVAQVQSSNRASVQHTIEAAQCAFRQWRSIPGPRRGELIRILADELRAEQASLGRLISLETGKILSEGFGEVQEMIDICTFAAGLSRSIAGLTLFSERSCHRIMETWHPLGIVGILSAFNFPAAVWAWNAAIALVCGNAILWKPSEKAPLTALATHALVQRAVARFGEAPDGLCGLLIGGRELGKTLVDDPRLLLISATGSTRMGYSIAPRIAARFGRAILELGGNNAAIVCPSAELDLTLRAVAFAAMGTAGQRCTTLRRLIVHESIYEPFIERLRDVYSSVTVGDPRDQRTLVGPLIDQAAWKAMQAALQECCEIGTGIFGGERVLHEKWPAAFYVRPALVEVANQLDVVKRETFAPILYVLRYRNLEEAIALQSDVPQGLSSAIFTSNLQEAEMFLSATGSDCGIANVNIGTSGAEIGGAFGGEKATGGGRESGSDAWKQYMRRATNTINFGTYLPLAQGVQFDLP